MQYYKCLRGWVDGASDCRIWYTWVRILMKTVILHCLWWIKIELCRFPNCIMHYPSRQYPKHNTTYKKALIRDLWIGCIVPTLCLVFTFVTANCGKKTICSVMQSESHVWEASMASPQAKCTMAHVAYRWITRWKIKLSSIIDHGLLAKSTLIMWSLRIVPNSHSKELRLCFPRENDWSLQPAAERYPSQKFWFNLYSPFGDWADALLKHLFIQECFNGMF